MRAPDHLADPALQDPAAGDLAACDEILQVMYWMRGEGFAEAVAPAELCRWVGLEADQVAHLLTRLVKHGWVEPAGDSGEAAPPSTYALTPMGVKEGGRRFADEFAELTRAGHGECNDENCDCRRTGRIEDCAHHHHS